MSDLQAAYRKLLVSPEQLQACRHAGSIAGFMALLKFFWHLPAISDDELLGELHRLNRQPMEMDANDLARFWLPYRYDAKSRTLAWCLPDGAAVEPFQDQAISRYRQQLINQLLHPTITLSSALSSAHQSQPVQPAGFIFHLSRCGSTLVSGSCAELESVSVLSESPVLTEVLLDMHLSPEIQSQLLASLIGWQARAVAPFVVGAQQVIIKWNAWDIFRWPQIRALYPHTPVLLLVRNPVEILASHQRSAGRHMAGDKSMAEFHPVFASRGENIMVMRTQVLSALINAMREIVCQQGVSLIDYRQLDVTSIRQICAAFGLVVDAAALARIQARTQRHSKEPERQFKPDSLEKQQLFDPLLRESIAAQLMPGYERLFMQGA